MAKQKKMFAGASWSFEPAAENPKPETVSLPPEKQKAKVRLEKRPKGKTATVITGFILSTTDRKTLATGLKRSCGSGGTDAEDSIEIQGDHCEAVRSALRALGWRAD